VPGAGLLAYGAPPLLPGWVGDRRAAASYWAQVVWSGLGEDELQPVAWLLRDGDRHSRLPIGDGERARRWADRLEDTAGEVALLRARRATRRQPRWRQRRPT
jgi:hypothetical protein